MKQHKTIWNIPVDENNFLSFIVFLIDFGSDSVVVVVCENDKGDGRGVSILSELLDCLLLLVLVRLSDEDDDDNNKRE